MFLVDICLKYCQFKIEIDNPASNDFIFEYKTKNVTVQTRERERERIQVRAQMSKTITTRDNHQILYVFCHLLLLPGALDIYISRNSLSVLRCTSFTYENYFPFLVIFLRLRLKHIYCLPVSLPCQSTLGGDLDRRKGVSPFIVFLDSWRLCGVTLFYTV